MTSPTVSPSGASVHAPARRPFWAKLLAAIVVLLVLAVIAIQLIPVNRTNPPSTANIQWDSPQTQALWVRACQDCHSNQTTWPWYSYVAPTSWLIYYDVVRGRSEFNLSTYDAASGGRPSFRTGQPTDLAYSLGRFLAGEGAFGEGGEDREGRRPPGAFPPEGGESGEGGEGGEGGFRPGGFGLANRLSEAIQEGQMPPSKYLILHPTGNLTTDERQQLLDGLLKTLGLSGQ